MKHIMYKLLIPRVPIMQSQNYQKNFKEWLSTNQTISTTKSTNDLWPQIIEHKKTTTYADGHPGAGSIQTQNVW